MGSYVFAYPRPHTLHNTFIYKLQFRYHSPYRDFFTTCCVKFIYLVSAAVLQWLPSCRDLEPTAHHHPHCSPTFRSFSGWVPVATCATTSGIEWSHISAIHPALHGAYNKQMISVPAAGRDLAVRMRAIVPAPIFPACGGAPPYCYASAVVTYTVTVDCGLSFTLLYIFDCSENATATAELGRNARYQAHPASVPSTGHRAVSLFQLTEV